MTLELSGYGLNKMAYKITSGIYQIRNSVNNKIYIGSAINMRKRFINHKSDLSIGKHSSSKLQRAWDKYGSDSFVFEKLIICSKENLLMYEQRAIDAYDAVNSGYNILPVAGNSLGRIVSEETKQKQSLTMKGREVSEETRKKMSASLIGNSRALGYKHSKETRDKISAAGKVRIHSKERNEKISKKLKGRKQTPEHTENHAKAIRGKKYPPISEESRIKMSLAATGHKRNLGQKKSEETKNKISISVKETLRKKRVLLEESKNG